MSDLMVYEPIPTSNNCYIWGSLNTGLGYLQPIGVALSAIATIKETLAPFFSHVPGHHRGRDYFQLSFAKSVLLGSLIGIPVSDFTYQTICWKQDPKTQEKMKIISKELIELINKSTHSSTACLKMRSNFERIYTDLAINYKNDVFLTCASEVLQKQFPKETRLYHKRTSSEEMQTYFQILQKQIVNRSSVQYHISDLWLKLLSHL